MSNLTTHHEAITFFTHETNSVPSVTAFISGFILLFGLISFLVKEKLFLSDSMVATLFGIAFGPIGFNFFDPKQWHGMGSDGSLDETTFRFCDIVISIQIMSAAISLPRKFWKKNWKTLGCLLGPITIYMVFLSSNFSSGL